MDFGNRSGEARKRGAAGRRLLLALAAAAACAAPSARPPAEPDAGAVPLPFDVDVSRTANLFHWVDNLAGTSGGKTLETYRRDWLRRVGPLSSEDRRALLSFREARLFTERLETRPPHNPGCVPLPEHRLSTRQRVTAAAIEARSLADLERRWRAIVPAQQARAMAAALRHFEGPFLAKIWPESRYLFPFAERLEAFMSRRRATRLVGRMARFLGARVDPTLRTRVGLVALLTDGPTHAEADGRTLLLEIRPQDRADDQVQVIFHEFAHDLFRRVPEARRASLARSFFERGRHGALAWKLLREGLPTALGQGVAQRELAPWDFRFRSSWYHIRPIDLFAHGIFGTVSDEMRAGRGVGARLPERAAAWIARSRFARVGPAQALEGVFVAAPRADLAAVAPFERRVESAARWRVALDEPEGRALLERYACAPIVVFLSAETVPAHAAMLDTLLVGGAESEPSPPPGAAGLVIPKRRPSGAPALLVLADGRPRVRDAAAALAQLASWPEGPTPLRNDRRR